MILARRVVDELPWMNTGIWLVSSCTLALAPIPASRRPARGSARCSVWPAKGQCDSEIATLLTAQGHRSARGVIVLPSTVRTIRLRHRVLNRESQSHPRCVDGYLTIPQLAEKLNVSRHWISDRIHNGTIVGVCKVVDQPG